MLSLCKGDPVVVTGRLSVREYEVDGARRYMTEIAATSVGPDLSRSSARVTQRRVTAVDATETAASEGPGEARAGEAGVAAGDGGVSASPLAGIATAAGPQPMGDPTDAGIVAHTGDPADDVLDLQQAVVPEVHDVVPVVRRHQVDHHDEVGRALDGGDAELADLVRQAGQGLADPVLDLDLGQVHVGAHPEGDRQGEHAVGGGL